jgi:hypothetical protein
MLCAVWLIVIARGVKVFAIFLLLVLIHLLGDEVRLEQSLDLGEEGVSLIVGQGLQVSGQGRQHLGTLREFVWVK